MRRYTDPVDAWRIEISPNDTFDGSHEFCFAVVQVQFHLQVSFGNSR